MAWLSESALVIAATPEPQLEPGQADQHQIAVSVSSSSVVFIFTLAAGPEHLQVGESPDTTAWKPTCSDGQMSTWKESQGSRG